VVVCGLEFAYAGGVEVGAERFQIVDLRFQISSEAAMRTMDSLETVELVMFVEEIFGTDIPEGDAEHLGQAEMVDWLELHLSNQRPNKEAQAFLKKLAKSRQRPELAESLNGTWRREQIAAIVREIFR
jgi:acyl carrier protein